MARKLQMSRPSWDNYFMEMAKVAATRGSCKRLQVGSVLVDRGLGLISTGYNGAPRGIASCMDEGCLEINGRCERTIHSEINALIQAGRNGASTIGSTLYVTHRPCLRCSMQIIQAGVSTVVFGEKYSSDNERLVIDLCIEANIHLYWLTIHGRGLYG